MRTQPGHHHIRIQRLGHVIHTAHPKPLQHVLGLGQARHEHHRHIARRRMRFQARAGLEAIHPRHHRIQQHDIRHHEIHPFYRRLAVSCHQHLITRRVQCGGEHFQIVRRIIDQHDEVLIGRGHGDAVHGV
ncbi:hypothetical protein D3C87_1589940 [compost metagenome]